MRKRLPDIRALHALLLHQIRVEYEIIIQALTDCEVYKMSYPTLKKIATENGTFAGELLRENCDFIGYMFFDSINQTFEPCLVKFAISYTSILQKSTRSLRKSRCRSQNLPALRERPLPRWSARFGS